MEPDIRIRSCARVLENMDHPILDEATQNQWKEEKTKRRKEEAKKQDDHLLTRSNSVPSGM